MVSVSPFTEKNKFLGFIMVYFSLKKAGNWLALNPQHIAHVLVIFYQKPGHPLLIKLSTAQGKQQKEQAESLMIACSLSSSPRTNDWSIMGM